MKQKLKLYKRKSPSVSWILTIAVLFFSTAYFVGAVPAWKAPVAPPTDVSTLESPIDFSSFVSKSKLQKQVMSGSVHIDNGGSYSARLGYNAAFSSIVVASLNDFGKHPSIATASDGMPIVAYLGEDSDLEIVKCKQVDCLTNNPLTDPIELDTAGTVGKYPSLKIGTDGYPFISYQKEASPSELRIIHCTSVDCSTRDNPVVLDTGSHSDFARYSSVAIGLNGWPVISYWDAANKDLKFVACLNQDCSQFNAPITLDGNSEDVGEYTSVVIASGNPLIAYKGVSDQLRVFKCGTPTCSLPLLNARVVFNQNPGVGLAQAKEDISMAINTADGNRPVIAYTNGSNAVYVAHCADATCNSLSPTLPNLIKTNANESALTVGADNLPVISFLDTVAIDLVVAHCADYACATLSPATPVIVEASNSVGKDTSIAIADGFPIISLIDTASENVRVVHCLDVACVLRGTYRIGAIGYGATGLLTKALPPFPLVQSTGIYGYAIGGLSNYGIYAYTPSSTAITGAVNEATDFAGYFQGSVSVKNSVLGSALGSLTAQRAFIQSNGGITADNPFVTAIQLDATTARAGTIAVAGSVSGAGGKDAGVFGKSTGANGVYISAVNESRALRAASGNSYGVYGFSHNGDGITGQAHSEQTLGRGVYGKSVDYGVYGKSQFTLSGYHFVPMPGSGGTPTTTQSGVGVFACATPNGGTQLAADFAGDVRILGSLQMGAAVNSYSGYVELSSGASDTVTGRIVDPQVTLTEPALQHAVAWCIRTGGCPANSITTLP